MLLFLTSNLARLISLVKAIINEALVYVTKFEDVLDIVGKLTNIRKSVELVWLGLRS